MRSFPCGAMLPSRTQKARKPPGRAAFCQKPAENGSRTHAPLDPHAPMWMAIAMGVRAPLPAVLIGCAAAIWSGAMIWLALAGGVQHDYGLYLAQWRLVLSGSDPWSTDNAYGPLHNVLAYLLPRGELAPKLAMAGALLVANAVLLRTLYRSAEGWFAVYLLAVPANCLIVSMGFAYGLNDALVAALVVGAIIARHDDHPIVAGVFLGLAVLLKFYPVILVPLFAMDTGRVRWKLIFAAAAVACAGMSAAALVWGEAIGQPFFLAAEREPKILSILSALSFHPELIGGRAVVDSLVRTNMIFVAVVALVSALVAWKTRMHWLEASVLGLLAVLVAYKVGHQQFFLPWLFLVAALPLAGTQGARRLALICIPTVLFLSVFQWGYAYGTDGYRQVLGGVRQNVGFVAFALALATFAAYGLSIRKDRPNQAPKLSSNAGR
jgi:hypothetical protein